MIDEVFQNFKRILSNPETPQALAQQTYQQFYSRTLRPMNCGQS
jgi:hypothetical protein